VFELAYHFDAADEPTQALTYALAAAEQARKQHALAIAEQQYRIAERGAAEASAPIRQQIAERLGEILMLRGRYAEAETQFEAARVLAHTNVERARIARNFGELAMKSGELDTAAQSLESGLELLGCKVPKRHAWLYVLLLWEIFIQTLHTWLPRWFVGRRPRQGADRELLVVALHNCLGYVYYFERGAAACLWTHLRGMNLAERYPPTPELALAYSSHAPAMAMVPLRKRGIAYARRSLAIRRELNDLWGQGQSLHFYGSVLYTASRYQESLDLSRQAIRILERTGDRWEMNIAGAHAAYNLYRLGEMQAAITETERIYQDGMTIGDYQSAGISVAIRTKAACGRVPGELIQAALERCGKDVHTRAELLMAEGMRLLAHRCPGDAVRVLEEADQAVRKQGLREEFTAAVVPWLATALRQELEAIPLTARARRRALLRRAWKTARRARWTAIFFRNNLPHALRELGSLAAIRGQCRRARRWLNRSLAIALHQGARYEQALTLEARGQIGLEVDWPSAADDLDQAARLLRELRPTQKASTTRAKPITLSLADRFDTVLKTGRQIASALSPDAIYVAVQDAALKLLRGDECVVLTTADASEQAEFIPVGGNSAPVSHALMNRALAAGRAVSFDSNTSTDVSDSLILAGFRSALYTPFFVRGKAAGCVCVTHRQVGGLFGEDEHRLADFIATVAGAALENAEGFARLQHWNADLEARVAERTAAAEARTRELQQALANVQTLNGLLPICASCKMIRDDHGYWHQVEQYIKEHSLADFSHGICPECAAKYFSRAALARRASEGEDAPEERADSNPGAVNADTP
jgi:tetratricopeptide (TPR) repeat protein